MLRKLNEMIFAVGLVSTMLAALLMAYWALGVTLRFLDPPEFLLPNGLTVQMPFDDLETTDIVDASGRSIRHRTEWICFDDLTVRLEGNGTLELNAVNGRITAERRGRMAEGHDLCGDGGYLHALIGPSLLMHRDWRFPCGHLNPDLDRFAQAQRFRDLCGQPAGTPALPAR